MDVAYQAVLGAFQARISHRAWTSLSADPSAKLERGLFEQPFFDVARAERSSALPRTCGRAGDPDPPRHCHNDAALQLTDDPRTSCHRGVTTTRTIGGDGGAGNGHRPEPGTTPSSPDRPAVAEAARKIWCGLAMYRPVSPRPRGCPCFGRPPSSHGRALPRPARRSCSGMRNP